MELPSFANVISAEAESLTELPLYRMEISNRDKRWRKLKEPLPKYAGSYVEGGYLYVVNFSEDEDLEPVLSEIAVENDDFGDFEEAEMNLLSSENWDLTSYILDEALEYLANINSNLEAYKGHIYLDEVLENVEGIEMYPGLDTKFVRDTDEEKIYLMVDFKPFLRPDKHDKIHKFTSKPESGQRMKWVEKVVEEFRSAGEIRIKLNSKTINFSDYLKFGEEVSTIDA